MKTVRTPPDAFAIGIMVLCCLCWGFQQVAMKLVADDVTPLMQIVLRCGFASFVLGTVLIWREGFKTFGDGTLKPGLIVGVLFALEFLFIGEGLRHTTASHMAVFLYTSPIFAALGLHLKVPEERLSGIQWAGILVTFGGIAVSFLGRSDGGNASNMLLGDIFGILAGATWGATTIGIRTSSLSEASAVKTLFYQLFCGFVLLVPAVILAGQTEVTFSPGAVLSLAFQAIIVAVGTLLVWFWLLRRYLATRLAVVSLMTPLFGVVFGVLILDEPIDTAFGVGAVLVLAGITLVSGSEMLRLRAARRSEAAG